MFHLKFPMPKKNKKQFPPLLLKWHSAHHRPLPWKGEKNPYYIWLSEIILQQTRTEQGLPYFEKFKNKYPQIKYLADAPEDEVMKMWEGLGYYSRARNLHAAAKKVAYELNGIFPDTYEGILSLKGVGPYTAAAIASFAYGLPYAVVDGNVYRVLSRIFGIGTPIDSTEGKKTFAKLAQELLEMSEGTPGEFNQAMMDFGARHCMPKLPKCDRCPMQSICFASQKNEVYKFPVKAKKIKRRERFFNYFIFNYGSSFYIKKRSEKDIWQNLYDFPLIESEHTIDGFDFVKKNKTWKKWAGKSKLKNTQLSPPVKHELTHQKIIVRFWEMETGNGFLPQKNWLAVEREKLSGYAFPKVIDRYIQKGISSTFQKQWVKSRGHLKP